jgi:hypothetical protein
MIHTALFLAKTFHIQAYCVVFVSRQIVQRNVRIMLNNNFTGVFALEYEAGPWDGVEGAQHLFQEVLAAM